MNGDEGNYWRTAIKMALGSRIGTDEQRTLFAKNVLLLLPTANPLAMRLQQQKWRTDFFTKLSREKGNKKLLERLAEKIGPNGKSLFLKLPAIKPGARSHVIEIPKVIRIQAAKLAKQSRAKRGQATQGGKFLCEVIARIYWDAFRSLPTTVKKDAQRTATPFDLACEQVHDLLLELKGFSVPMGEVTRKYCCKLISALPAQSRGLEGLSKTHKWIPSIIITKST